MNRPTIRLTVLTQFALCSLALFSGTWRALAAGPLQPGEILVTNGDSSFSGLGAVVRLDPVTGAQEILSQGGLLSHPFGMGVDGNGQILVADHLSAAGPAVIRIDPATGLQAVLSSGGLMHAPFGLAIEATGDIVVADRRAFGGRGGVIRVDPATGAQSAVSGAGLFNGGPTGLTIGPTGDIFVSDSTAGGPLGAVVRVDPLTGAQSLAYAGGLIRAPTSVSFTSTGDALITLNLASPSSGVVRVDAATGAHSLVSSGGLFREPFSSALTPSGDLLVADELGGVSPSPPGAVLRVDVVSGAQTNFSSGGSLTQPSVVLIVPSGNAPPIAGAGPDQTLECAGATTAVVLEGNGSSDPDGDTLTYTWTGPFPEGGGTVHGVTPTVTLPLGPSTITLVVNDGQADSEPDTLDVLVTVGVNGLLPPLDQLVRYPNAPPLPDKAFKRGRTLPLKLQLLCGGVALTDEDVAAPRIVGLTRNGDAVDPAVIDPDAGEANNNGVLFRYSEPNWVYNLSTRDLATGTYTIHIQMPDSRIYAAGFVLR